MYSPEAVARIDQLRALSSERKLTDEENIEVISLIRKDRVGASYASSASKAKKSAAKPVDGEALLDSLMGL